MTYVDVWMDGPYALFPSRAAPAPGRPTAAPAKTGEKGAGQGGNLQIQITVSAHFFPGQCLHLHCTSMFYLTWFSWFWVSFLHAQLSTHSLDHFTALNEQL